MAKFALARSVEKSSELEQAASAYEDVIKSEEKHPAAHHRLAVVCDKQGKFDQAEQHYRLALQHDPQNAELLCDFGYSLYLRGQWPEAEAHLRQALRHAPQLARNHNNLGLIEARTGRIEEAIRSFQAAGCTPSKARANVAFALMLDERWLEAQQQLQMAMSLDPNSPVIRKRMDELQAVLARTSTPESNVIPTSHSAPVNRG